MMEGPGEGSEAPGEEAAEGSEKSGKEAGEGSEGSGEGYTFIGDGEVGRASKFPTLAFCQGLRLVCAARTAALWQTRKTPQVFYPGKQKKIKTGSWKYEGKKPEW